MNTHSHAELRESTPSAKNGSEQDYVGFKSQVNSITVEVRFMIDSTSMRLREFITEAQAMDPSFRIMPLEGEGG
jgi:hypothetical protein